MFHLGAIRNVIKKFFPILDNYARPSNLTRPHRVRNDPVQRPTQLNNIRLSQNPTINKFYTGLGKSPDGKQLLLYKRGKPLSDSTGKFYELAPSQLFVKQGAEDCDVLSALIGALSNPQARKKINEICYANSTGDLVITSHVDSDQVYVQKLASALKGKKGEQNRSDLAAKGYQIDLTERNKRITVTVDAKKLLSMIEEQWPTGIPSGARTNSLFVMVMEHLIGNLHRLVKQRKGVDQFSLVAHDEVNKNSFHTYLFISNLLGYSFNFVCPEDAKQVFKLCQDFYKHKIGVAHRNDNGYVVVMDKRRSHALALDKVMIKDKKFHLQLIDPNGHVEILKPDHIRPGDLEFVFCAPEAGSLPSIKNIKRANNPFFFPFIRTIYP